MSSGLAADNLLLTLPEVLRRDERMQALAQGIADVLAARPAEIERLLIYSRIDELPEDLLDRLAYDFKVDWWDADYTLAQKRQTLKDNWQVHRRLGTKAAVEQAICAVYPKTKVLEWFDYGGEPYHFKLEIDLTDSDYNKERQNKVLSRVDYYKNLRSHLDDVYYFAKADPVILVNPERFRPISLAMSFYFSNQPNDITLLNGRRRLDGSWKLDSTFRGVVMQNIELHMAWQERRQTMDSGTLLVPEIKLPNHNRNIWPGITIASKFANRTRAGSKTLALNSNLREKSGAMAGEAFVKDTMWRLNGSMHLDGSKKLNAAIVKEMI